MSTSRLDPSAPLPSADRVEHSDRVVICGAGPTGLSAALTLALAGVEVLVIEKGEALSRESRASTFHPPTLELLDDLGVVDEVIARGLKAPSTQFRDRRLGPVATFDLGVLADVTDYPFRVQLEQDKLTALLLERLTADFGDRVEVRFGWRAHGIIGQTHDGAALLAGHDSGFVELRAPWVIAADGAHSPVRQSLDIELRGETYPEQFLVVSVRDELTELLDDLAYVNYVADPDEWMVLLRTPDHWRLLFPIREADTTSVLDPNEVQRRLNGVVDDARSWDVVAASLYVVTRCVADRMRQGRVLLAGDAAHQNSPLGGMGMNSGIQDAVSCGRRLARVISGDDDLLLDGYDTLRRRVATEYVQADSHANWLALREPDPARRAELQDELRAIAADPRRHRERMARTAMLDAVRDNL